MKHPRFFTVIIGTELLNGRREDAHFKRVNALLLQKGWNHSGSFMIEDKVELLSSVFELIKNTEESVMFCFGGIGATPDDYTREIAARVFSAGEMELHAEAASIITGRFGEAAYPNRINMAKLPKGAGLIPNPINQVPGFSLEGRFFFMPGFPEMAAPMCEWVVERHFPQGEERHSYTVSLAVSEERFIEYMKSVPEGIEVSSLPRMGNYKEGRYTPEVTISIRGYDKILLDTWYGKLVEYIENNDWQYTVGEEI